MTAEPAALFTWNDIVRVLPDAPQQCRPGERAWIVGITEQEKRSGEYLERYPEGTIYTIEFEDGFGSETEERFLIREIVLDANEWKTKEDFYRKLLAALKAPDWHGHNLDARRCPGNPGQLIPWVSRPKAERKPYAQIPIHRGADRLDSQRA